MACTRASVMSYDSVCPARQPTHDIYYFNDPQSLGHESQHPGKPHLQPPGVRGGSVPPRINEKCLCHTHPGPHVAGHSHKATRSNRQTHTQPHTTTEREEEQEEAILGREPQRLSWAQPHRATHSHTRLLLSVADTFLLQEGWGSGVKLIHGCKLKYL